MIPFPILWAQQPAAGPSALMRTLMWLLVWGEPSITDNHLYGGFFWFGGVINWCKVVGLFCLLGWVGSRLIAASKGSSAPRNRPLDYAALAALVGAFACVLLQVLNQTGRVKLAKVGGASPVSILSFACAGVILAWVEYRLWTGLKRLGHKSDLSLLAAMHVALAAGFGVAFGLRAQGGNFAGIGWTDGIRIGGTYMGLVVLAWVAADVIREVITVRPRRLYAIAWQAWVESFRRMGAPWVVLVVFGLILLFFDWFVGSRTAEMGRSYIGSLMFLSAILMMLMIMILSPISLPNDIRQQTIYTIVSKPVRRIELIWGRIIGYMALVTLMLAIFGGISLAYLDRNIGGEIARTRAAAARASKAGKVETARGLEEQADQLQSRMTARVPVKGSLIFIDSTGVERAKGIDVGQEMEFRSHVEGATPSKAIWRFGIVDDPEDYKIRDRSLRRHLDRRIPVDSLLQPDTIEYVQNRMIELGDEQAESSMRQQGAGTKASDANAEGGLLARSKEQVESLRKELVLLQDKEAKFLQRAREARAQKKTTEAQELLAQAQALHSRQIPIEMNFTIYRTTKGEVGEPVYASLVASNPRAGIKPVTEVFPIHEYYTDKQYLPARILVGSRGFLTVEIQCMSPNQYLGMAESDFYILSSQGGYRANFIKGLIGVWLQAMVLTAVGVFAGTFLSWPVAFLTTIFFGVAGYVGFGFLQGFALHLFQGGGPFESMIRMLGHDNLQVDLAPTLAVVSAKTFDMILSPILERLVYLVPNFQALDVSNTVADGFAVTGGQVFTHILTGLGYALPFSVAGYFILKNREVAA